MFVNNSPSCLSNAIAWKWEWMSRTVFCLVRSESKPKKIDHTSVVRLWVEGTEFAGSAGSNIVAPIPNGDLDQKLFMIGFSAAKSWQRLAIHILVCRILLKSGPKWNLIVPWESIKSWKLNQGRFSSRSVQGHNARGVRIESPSGVLGLGT